MRRSFRTKKSSDGKSMMETQKRKREASLRIHPEYVLDALVHFEAMVRCGLVGDNQKPASFNAAYRTVGRLPRFWKASVLKEALCFEVCAIDMIDKNGAADGIDMSFEFVTMTAVAVC